MKTTILFLIAVVATAILPNIASADSITLTTFPTATYNGYYVGPVGGTFDGAPVEIICDTFNKESYVPSSFDVNVETIGNLTGAYFASQPTAYKEMAILNYEMSLPQNIADVGTIQYAIWNLFDQAAGTPGDTQNWLDWAGSQSLNSWTYSGDVFTPSDTPNQEFTDLTASPTPEPTSLVLFGTGFLFLAYFSRRLRSTSSASRNLR